MEMTNIEVVKSLRNDIIQVMLKCHLCVCVRETEGFIQTEMFQIRGTLYPVKL